MELNDTLHSSGCCHTDTCVEITPRKFKSVLKWTAPATDGDASVPPKVDNVAPKEGSVAHVASVCQKVPPVSIPTPYGLLRRYAPPLWCPQLSVRGVCNGFILLDPPRKGFSAGEQKFYFAATDVREVSFWFNQGKG